MKTFEPVSDVLNQEVFDGKGDFVGWLGELLVDTAGGRIEYARITLPGDKKPGRHSVVVPWSALQRTTEEPQRWHVAAQRQTLEKLSTPDMGTDPPPTSRRFSTKEEH